MKSPLTIGIVGGMSPESTISYYQRIVRRHQSEFRNHGYPRVVIASVSFQKYIDWQHQENWNRIAAELENEFHAVSKAGADFAIPATNTMHKVLPQINSPIPILNILDAVARYSETRGIRSVGLTGTRFTMSDGFYDEGLEKRGLKVLLPNKSGQEMIHNIIYEELIFGKVNALSAREFDETAQDLLNRGADAILLGCTELALLMQEVRSQSEYIDSTQIHADAAWETSIAGHLS